MNHVWLLDLVRPLRKADFELKMDIFPIRRKIKSYDWWYQIPIFHWTWSHRYQSCFDKHVVFHHRQRNHAASSWARLWKAQAPKIWFSFWWFLSLSENELYFWRTNFLYIHEKTYKILYNFLHFQIKCNLSLWIRVTEFGIVRFITELE